MQATAVYKTPVLTATTYPHTHTQGHVTTVGASQWCVVGNFYSFGLPVLARFFYNELVFFKNKCKTYCFQKEVMIVFKENLKIKGKQPQELAGLTG